MATKTAADVRPEIPLQNDGRTELQALAAALSHQVEQRHRTRGAHDVEVVTDAPTFDLTAAAEPLPVREPEPRSAIVTRGVRRAVPLVFAAILTTVVSVAGWSASHSGASAAGPTTPAPDTTATTSTTAAPTTPAEWGAAAHQRLSTAGHPVDVFACQGAYAADIAVAGGALLPATTHPDMWRAYLATCLSDMSGASVGRSG